MIINSPLTTDYKNSKLCVRIKMKSKNNHPLVLNFVKNKTEGVFQTNKEKMELKNS